LNGDLIETPHTEEEEIAHRAFNKFLDDLTDEKLFALIKEIRKRAEKEMKK
jgi:hypothetical protein